MTTATMPARAVVHLPARALTTGLQLTWDGPDGQPLEPVTVTAVEPHDARLLFTLSNGLRVPFGPDDQVAMVCAATDHPAWCPDQEECERHRDPDGCIYHGSTFYGLDIRDAEHGREEHLSVGVSRIDDPDGTVGDATVHVLAQQTPADLDMPAAQARTLAALLLRAADDSEPEHDVTAENVRLGDEILTGGGWQTVTMLLADGGCGTVAIYTVHDENEAVLANLGELVRVRRSGRGDAVEGRCAP